MREGVRSREPKTDLGGSSLGRGGQDRQEGAEVDLDPVADARPLAYFTRVLVNSLFDFVIECTQNMQILHQNIQMWHQNIQMWHHNIQSWLQNIQSLH